MEKSLTIVALAAHPDDAELSCGGTLIKHALAGHRTGIIDFTVGELGTRGSGPLRLQEAANAGEILGLSFRENLGLKDGFFGESEEELHAVIRMIRKHRPDIVLANAVSDRHPDHGRGGALASRACFLAGLRRIETELEGKPQDAWRPNAVFHYIQDRHMKPDFCIDITNVYDQRKEAIMAFKSQFYDPTSNEPITPIATKGFLELLWARSVEMGHYIGAPLAEGFIAETPLNISLLADLL